jgi:hypothetical protein
VFRNLDPFPPLCMRIHSGILFAGTRLTKHSKSNLKPKSLCKWQSVSQTALAPGNPSPKPTFSHVLLKETDRSSHSRLSAPSVTRWFCLSWSLYRAYLIRWKISNKFS